MPLAASLEAPPSHRLDQAPTHHSVHTAHDPQHFSPVIGLDRNAMQPLSDVALTVHDANQDLDAEKVAEIPEASSEFSLLVICGLRSARMTALLRLPCAVLGRIGALSDLR